MKLRYMVEYALRDRIRAPRYDPIGVWVQGPSPGLDLVIEFLPGHAEAREDAEWVVNRLVENDVRSLPEDFLAYRQSTLPPYRACARPSSRRTSIRRQRPARGACWNGSPPAASPDVVQVLMTPTTGQPVSARYL